MAGTYDFTVPAAQDAAKMLDEFGNYFHTRVNALEQSIAGANASQAGLFSGGITTGSTALDAVALQVKKTVVEMGQILDTTARGYASSDVSSSDTVTATNNALSGIIN